MVEGVAEVGDDSTTPRLIPHSSPHWNRIVGWPKCGKVLDKQSRRLGMALQLSDIGEQASASWSVSQKHQQLQHFSMVWIQENLKVVSWWALCLLVSSPGVAVR